MKTITLSDREFYTLDCLLFERLIKTVTSYELLVTR